MYGDMGATHYVVDLAIGDEHLGVVQEGDGLSAPLGLGKVHLFGAGWGTC